MLTAELTTEFRRRLESGDDYEPLIESLTEFIARLGQELSSTDAARVDVARADVHELNKRLLELTDYGEQKLAVLHRELQALQRQRNLERRYGLDRH